MGSFDVATLLAMHAEQDAPTTEPMHGQRGEVRRNPSTDQKKVRRKMTKQAQADEAATETVPQLLAKAAKATTLEEQSALLAQAEQQTTQKYASQALANSLDLTVKESVSIIPRGTHELHTEATDWLMAEGLHATASANDAEQMLVVEAGMWFNRVPDFVKVDQEEFRVQAVNKGTYLASQFGDAADAARQAFITETERLYRQGQRTGSIKTATSVNPPEDPSEPRESPNQHPDQHPIINSVLPGGEHPVDTSKIRQEVGHTLSGQDAAGVRGMAEGYAAQQLRGGSLNKAAALAHQGEDDSLAAVLAGMDPSGMVDEADKALDSTSNGVRQDAEGYAAQQLADQPRTAASGVPQVGLPTDSFSTGVAGYPDVNTSSERSPSLQEIENYQGWNGSSVVPPGDTGAQSANNDGEPTKDFAGTQGGFPVSGATHAAKVAAQLTKESHMDQATCPTCSGHGVVAVRKQAYSGLPQVDQIVNADETQGATPLPPDVAFPLTGWGASPQQGQQNVQQAINQAEGQIDERNARSPLATTGGRDNSGWMGDMGAKGTDYPGYSAPSGYDGSTSTGYADPVYGYGGDNGNQPLQPYGEMEANDETNNPSEPYDPSGPHNNDQAYRQVSPGMSTSGSFHPDPYIAQAQQQIIAAQHAIAARNAQLGIG